RAVVRLLSTGEFQQRSAELGKRLHERLGELVGNGLTAVRGRGLWAGIDIDGMTGRQACERLAVRGVLCKETHGATLRIAPPLVITAEELDRASTRSRRSSPAERPILPGVLITGLLALLAAL